MLPAAHRLTDGASFREVTRGGRRGASRTLVTHLIADEASQVVASAPVKVGFVVSRAVGGSVVRNRVRRRLRHLMSQRLVALPAGAHVVVRALPASVSASSRDLAGDLDRCLERCGRPDRAVAAR